MITGKKELRSIIASMKSDDPMIMKLDNIIKRNVSDFFYDNYIRNFGTFAYITQLNNNNILSTYTSMDIYDKINVLGNGFSICEASYSYNINDNNSYKFCKYNYLSCRNSNFRLNYSIKASKLSLQYQAIQLLMPEYIAILMKDGRLISPHIHYNFYKYYHTITQDNFVYMCSGGIEDISLPRNHLHYKCKNNMNFYNKIRALYDGFRYRNPSIKSNLTIKDIVTIMDASIKQLCYDIEDNLKYRFQAEELSTYNICFQSHYDYIEFLESNNLMKYNGQPFYMLTFPMVIYNDVILCDYYNTIKIIFYPFLQEAVLYCVTDDNAANSTSYQINNLISRKYNINNCEDIVKEMIDYYHEKLTQNMQKFNKNIGNTLQDIKNFYPINRETNMPILTDYTLVLVGNILNNKIFRFKDSNNNRLTFYYEDISNYKKCMSPKLINKISDINELKDIIMMKDNTSFRNSYIDALSKNKNAYYNYVSNIRRNYLNFEECYDERIKQKILDIIQYHHDTIIKRDIFALNSYVYFIITSLAIRISRIGFDTFTIEFILPCNKKCDILNKYNIVNIEHKINGLSIFKVIINDNITEKNVSFSKDINNADNLDNILHNYCKTIEGIDYRSIHNSNDIIEILKQYLSIAYNELRSINFITIFKELYQVYKDAISSNKNAMNWKKIYHETNEIIKNYRDDVNNTININCSNNDINNYENLEDLSMEFLYYYNNANLIRIYKRSDI